MGEYLLVTKGTSGDIVPFLAMGAALTRAGHSVRLLTHSYYEDSVRRAGIELIPIDRISDFDGFIADGPLLETAAGVEKFARKHLLASLRSEYELIRAACRSQQTTIVARYMADFPAQMAAEVLRIPFVRIYTAVAQLTTRRLFAQLCAERLEAELNGARQSVGLPPILDWRHWIDSPGRHAGTWPEWFAHANSEWPAGFRALGFLTLDSAETGELPPIAVQMLEAAERPILITGGTARWSLAAQFYNAAAGSCDLAGIPALLVTRFRELVPSPLPPGVQWFPYLPFASVVGRVRAVIHHAGTSILVRALKAGIPQMLLPYGADRPDTAARLKQLGVAECVKPPAWRADVVSASLLQLLESNQIGAACGELAHKLSKENAEDRVLQFMNE